MPYLVTFKVDDELSGIEKSLDVLVFDPHPPHAALFEDIKDAERVLDFMQDLYPDEEYKINNLEAMPATPSPVL